MSTGPNVPLMRKAVEWVETQEALPVGDREWDQNVWRADTTKNRSCGTAYCVAGYVCDQDPDTQWATNDSSLEYFDEVVATPLEVASILTSDWGDGLRTVTAGDRAARLLGVSLYDAPFNGWKSATDIRAELEELAGERL